MAGISENIRKAIPWIEPLLDYFDWRKRVIAAAAGLAVLGWSFMKGLPWPVIVVTAFTMMVAVAYALVLPGLVKLINVGYRQAPNLNIWKHKKQFDLCQAACLLGDTVPVYNESAMTPDAHAWFMQLCDAVRSNEITRIQSAADDYNHSARYNTGVVYNPHVGTDITRAEFIKFCAARGRHPEFLKD